MTFYITKRAFLAFGTALALALSGCTEQGDDAASGEQAEPGTQSISALIAGQDDLAIIGSLLSDSGLGDTFDGLAAYTVFAPTDAALGNLPDDFTGEAARPALVAMLREHVMPGYVTVDDITRAVEEGGGSVEMRTMGEGTLTFRAKGDNLVVSGGSGESAAIVQSEMLGGNGVVIPVDAVLKDFDPEA
ncbi:fasciclin domain-containing protein [Aurantiacibacter aquimixticola]|uniref:Fasciclin domain-containing protein n=1 Tax=Aurantiacibacter aquimixticola TaxID=1958945 RepID=A0A419RTB4_9SPHN|nr:fasciclin domain-containing protein [Aurantiacibacter aquimixticola]RJY09031.1 fasciclin domain-containing protein [Aurantiacibacter aquimixticola]